MSMLLFSFVRYTRAGVQALLKGVTTSNGDDATSRDVWLPPLTADLLLQPHLGLFPFPPYFSALHKFLAEFYHSGIDRLLYSFIFSGSVITQYVKFLAVIKGNTKISTPCTLRMYT